jgi:putative NIF3 family GTP cyclohydrolase 1 type 2
MSRTNTASGSLKTLVGELDREFDVLAYREDLVQWAVTEENCRWINPTFLKQKTGLMIVGLEKVQSVRTAVFVTDRVVEKLSNEPPCLLFTHHNFNYFEDERGLQPMGREQMEKLVKRGHSLYVTHAPLDTHPVYGTSLALAEEVGIRPKELFYNYHGAPAALVGDAGDRNLQDFADHVRKSLLRPKVDIMQHTSRVRKVAVAAGGGDVPDILQEAYDLGCDTMVMGTLENRWAILGIQEAHEKFLLMNEKLKLNLIGASHFATERPAMIKVVRLFEGMGVPCAYCEDEELLNA